MDGFLGYRASIMLDVVFLAMFAVLPIMGWSIWLVKYRQNYRLHKTVQLILGGVLLATVALFEADMRWNGWRHRAEVSAYFNDWVFYSLYIHLCFAVTTAVLWVAVIVQALRKFPKPPMPCAYSPKHIFWAKLAAIDMLMTAVTGWIFYWLAFVC